MSNRGFSALEALIGAAIFAIVVVATYKGIDMISRSSTTAEVRLDAESELRQLLATIKLAWRYRTRPDPAFALAAGPFVASGPAPCQGTFVINQKDRATDAARSVTFATRCIVAPFSVDRRNGAAHKDLSCAQGTSEVLVNWVGPSSPPNGRFPQGNRIAGATLCFRLQSATTVAVEGGVVYGVGGDLYSVQDRIVLSTLDRAAGIEYMK